MFNKYNLNNAKAVKRQVKTSAKNSLIGVKSENVFKALQILCERFELESCIWHKGGVNQLAY